MGTEGHEPVTRAQVQAACRPIEGPERFRIWKTVCKKHENWLGLPRTIDTRELYCPNCCVFFSDQGAQSNMPVDPARTGGTE